MRVYVFFVSMYWLGAALASVFSLRALDYPYLKLVTMVDDGMEGVFALFLAVVGFLVLVFCRRKA